MSKSNRSDIIFAQYTGVGFGLLILAVMLVLLANFSDFAYVIISLGGVLLTALAIAVLRWIFGRLKD